MTKCNLRQIADEPTEFQAALSGGKHPLNHALTMSPRPGTKRLQANCQAQRTDQLPFDQPPVWVTMDYITALEFLMQPPLSLPAQSPSFRQPYVLLETELHGISEMRSVTNQVGFAGDRIGYTSRQNITNERFR
ncbi:hypothetical protein CSKR_110854 [Clonorchis sinensis]|uniref:Uncharacterized protein n=1 Tax=Clonorchis sinensis TaxID=79923 RepID=A0A419QIB7_CLOSI|nr:hypothetical protein CSKR_110854 [Clonorchis sinensis]